LQSVGSVRIDPFPTIKWNGGDNISFQFELLGDPVICRFPSGFTIELES
jgi:hypothetical protein